MTTQVSTVPSVSIIIPTFREAENLPLLLPQLAQAMRTRGWVWEAIVVDDNSPDGTREVLEALSRTMPQVRYKIRTDERGLSSAVLAGMSMARYVYVVVMDADLSHPPQSVPTLVDPLVREEADVVVGSRYVDGGKTEDWSRLRWLNSVGATLLSKPLVGGGQGVKDPMAGFFALRRSILARADALNPIGYKIGLELMVKCHVRHVMEVPITFRNRVHGQSKLTMKEQFRYLEHLSRLYDYKFPIGSPRVKFLVAAGCGIAACLGVVGGLARWADFGFPINMAFGLLALIAVTLVFFARYVRTQRDFIVMKQPFSEFIYISLAELITGWFFAVSTHPATGHGWVMQAVVGLSALLAVRYTLRKAFLHDLRGIRGVAKPAATLRLTLGMPGVISQSAASA